MIQQLNMRQQTSVVLLGSMLLQLLVTVVKPGILGHWVGPLVSLAAAIVPFWYIGRQHLVARPVAASLSVPWLTPGLFLAMVVGLFVYAGVVDAYLLDAAHSDVIPTVQLFVQRLLTGAVPYDTITEFGYYLAPTYLPMHWLPFVVSEWIGMDARVWSLILFYVFSLVFVRPLQLSATQRRTATVLSYVPVLFMLLLLLFQRDDMGYSIELLLAGYYLLFCRSLKSINPWLAAAALVCILLSRFSLVLWLPLAVVVLWQQRGFPFILKVGIPVLAGILLLYVLPFLLERPQSFKNAQDYYALAAHKEWSGQSWQQAGDDPFQISRGLGFAYWCYRLMPGTLAERIEVVRLLHLCMSLLTVAVFIWLYFRNYRTKMPLPVFLMGSLHVYLWVFTLFIQVPYPYLFFIPLAVSLAWTAEVSLAFTVEAAPDQNR